MLRIGLTGGIGSGKTTVAKIFELLNVPVYYADAASKRLYETDAGLMQSIKQHFGEDVYLNNKLDRAKLSSIVFNDPQKLELLNSLVHPPTLQDAENWMQQQSEPYVIKEAALIFESGSFHFLDYVIGVKSAFSLRLKRVMEREAVSKETVLIRMDQQLDEEIKMRLCDFVINNNEQKLLIPQVLRLHQTLLNLAGSRKIGNP